MFFEDIDLNINFIPEKTPKRLIYMPFGTTFIKTTFLQDDVDFSLFFPFRVTRKWSNLPTATNHARENFLEHFKSLELSICTPIHNRINQNSQYTYFRSQKLEIKTRVKLPPPRDILLPKPPGTSRIKVYIRCKSFRTWGVKSKFCNS